MISRRQFLKIMGGGFIASAALSTYAFAIEPLYRLRLKTYRFTPPNWTAGLKLRVALIADIHACKPWMTIDRIEDIVARTNDLEPDLTLLLGDYSAGMNLVTDYVHSRQWAPALGKLKASSGVYSVLGNHDWWEDKSAQRAGHGPTFGQLALQREGIPVLENDAVRLLKDDKAFWIAGLGDQLAFLPHAKYGRHLIVSGGLGCSIAPIRFGSPPEIVLLELGEGL